LIDRHFNLNLKETEMNKLNLQPLRYAVLASAVALANVAHAALPAGAETAIETYETDVTTVFGLLIAAGIAIFAVRKLGQKMGWL
jgi:Inovirus Coat protein B